MSTHWFKLSKEAFRLRPDPEFLYLHGENRSSFDTLSALMASGQGSAALIGDAGMGKTTLLNALALRANEHIRVVQIRQLGLNLADLTQTLAEQLGLSIHELRAARLGAVLSRRVSEARRAGGNIAILVDEADQLSMPVLCELLATGTAEPAPAIVLAGERVLIDALALLRKRGMAMRFTGSHTLTALMGSEIADYVAYRIGVVGGDYRKIFEREALAMVVRYAGGSPQLINILCDHAMNLAEARGLTRVGISEMRGAAEELKLIGENSVRVRLPSAAELEAVAAEMGATLDADSGEAGDLADTARNAVRELQVRQNGRVVARVTLMPGPLLVGRGEDAGLRLDGPFVSRHHCRITTTSDGILLEDLGSTNGVQVNGSRLRSHRLTPGDRISLGDHSLTYVEGDAGKTTS
ncbi:MAG: FHA domain-containing protein [Steroidobacteraceae bacterium]